jgi:beta-glucosidase
MASGSGAVGNVFVGTTRVQTFPSYASNADICLVFMNVLSGEAADRTELYNEDQDNMVTSVTSTCNNTGARLVDKWMDNEDVTALVYGGLLGQDSGDAIADILYGNINPSGRLTYTIAKNESEYPSEICTTAVCNFIEGVYVDYRHFDE